jgi:hypothetical protein
MPGSYPQKTSAPQETQAIRNQSHRHIVARTIGVVFLKGLPQWHVDFLTI